MCHILTCCCNWQENLEEELRLKKEELKKKSQEVMAHARRRDKMEVERDRMVSKEGRLIACIFPHGCASQRKKSKPNAPGTCSRQRFSTFRRWTRGNVCAVHARTDAVQEVDTQVRHADTDEKLIKDLQQQVMRLTNRCDCATVHE